jgi:hypothetical protein
MKLRTIFAICIMFGFGAGTTACLEDGGDTEDVAEEPTQETPPGGTQLTCRITICENNCSNQYTYCLSKQGTTCSANYISCMGSCSNCAPN